MIMKRLFILTLLCWISLVVCAATTFTVDGIEYSSSTSGVASVKSGSACSGAVVIPDTVVYNNAAYAVRTITASAFKSNTSITSITIPQTITSIGSSAFSGCTGLTSVKWNAMSCADFSSTATSQPFNGLTNITSIEFGDKVTKIPAYLCYKLSGLNCTLVIPDAVTAIGGYAFHGCSKLSGALVIPDAVTKINTFAFYNCNKLTSVTIGKSITSIGSSAFAKCTGLTSVQWNAVNCGKFTSTATSQPFNGLTNITSIVFGDEVTTIPAYLCYGLTGLSGSVVIPDAVTAIGTNAFNGCSGLTSATIGKAVTTIDTYAFTGCIGLASVNWKAVNCGNFTSTASSQPFNGLTNITSIEFGNEVTKIPAYLCYGLSSVNGMLVIPETVTSIGAYSFYGCSGLTGALVIPDAVTTINTYTFYGCSGLTGALVIPDAVTKIDTYAFNGCSGLTSVTVGKAVTSIGSSAFAGCTGLTQVQWNASNCGNFTSTATSQPFNGLTNITSIEFGDMVKKIPAYLCYGLSSVNGTLVIPKAVTSIGSNAFAGCTGLTNVKWNAINCGNFSSTATSQPFNGLTNITSIEFGNEVATIPAYLCYNLTGLNCPLVIPDAVTAIGTYAFNGCKGATSVTIGKAVTTIDTYAFARCTGLTSAKWNAVNCADFTSTANTQPFNGLTNITSIEFGDEVTKLPASLCYKLSGLNCTLVIPEAVTAIGSSAFAGCTGLTCVKWNAVNCGNFTSTASSQPFNGLTNITSIEFGDEVTKIPAYLCNGLSGLNCTLVIPDAVTTIGTNAFNGCCGLTGALVIPEAVTTIDTNTFNGCSGLTGELVIPEAVTSIGASAFNSCSGLTSVTIGKAVTSIGSSAFAGCTGLTDVKWNAVNCGNFTATATSQPFNGLTNITSIEFGDDVTKIPAYLCHNLTGLNNTLVIPAGVTAIDTYTFYGCSGLTGVIFGDSVASIGSHAFSGCSALSNTLVIPPSVATIGQGAFYGCSGITKVILEDGSDELDNGYASYTYSGGDPYAGYGYDGSSSCTYTFNSCNVDSIYIGRKVKNYLFGSCSSSWGNGSSSDYYGKNTKVKTIIYSCNQKYLEKLCTGIETLTFLESVTALSSSSIASTALREVYVYWIDPPTIAESFFTTTAYNNAILHVPEGTADTYKARQGWKNFTIVENVEPIVVGDVDGDGVLSISDVCDLIDMMLNGEASSVDPRIYDLNNNGKLDIGDIVSLIDILLNYN